MPETVHAQGFEPHDAASNSKLNWLRAGVLGANDGIVSIAALMVGVAAATQDPAALLLTGVAGLSAGAISMALGEYVSVSSQRDSEKAWIVVGESLENLVVNNGVTKFGQVARNVTVVRSHGLFMRDEQDCLGHSCSLD